MSDTGRLGVLDRQALAERYAPVLVLFPEHRAAGRPDVAHTGAGDVRGDFHPRTVDLIMDHAHLYRGVRPLLRRPRRLLRLDRGHPLVRHLPEVVRRRFPTPAPNARHVMPSAVRGGIEAATSSVLDLVGVGRDRTAADAAWERYFDALAGDADGRYARTVYARVLHGDEVTEWTIVERLRWYSQVVEIMARFIEDSAEPMRRLGEDLEQFLAEVDEAVADLSGEVDPAQSSTDVVVQYWMCYFYNDWHNRHEVDWETVTVTLRADGDAAGVDGLLPDMVAYSSHTSGRRRPWCDVERHGTHPVTYVASGSHAGFFAHRPDGYSSGLPIAVKVPWINVMVDWELRRAGLGHRDRVPDPARAPGSAAILRPGDDYRVRLLPNLDPRSRTLTSHGVHDLAWLVYPGLWGDRPLMSIGGSGPKGPLWQGIKSDNPFRWVATCAPDDRFAP